MLEQEVFNNDDYEVRLAHNHELMALVAGEFIKEATELYGCLQTHLASYDWLNFTLVTHRLKGASLEVSGYRFCQLITEVESLVKEENGKGISSHLTSLKVEFDKLVAALEQEVLA
jgi:hypothetical protein